MSAKLKVQAAVVVGVQALFVVHAPVFAGEIEKIEILKISPEDGLAVIKGSDGKMGDIWGHPFKGHRQGQKLS